jgi:hypothetical protein
LQGSLPALHTVAANFKARDENVELAVALYLPLDAIKQIALEFLYIPATQAGHVHVIPLRTTLVEVAVTLDMKQVEFVHETLAL